MNNNPYTHNFYKHAFDSKKMQSDLTGFGNKVLKNTVNPIGGAVNAIKGISNEAKAAPLGTYKKYSNPASYIRSNAKELGSTVGSWFKDTPPATPDATTQYTTDGKAPTKYNRMQQYTPAPADSGPIDPFASQTKTEAFGADSGPIDPFASQAKTEAFGADSGPIDPFASYRKSKPAEPSPLSTPEGRMAAFENLMRERKIVEDRERAAGSATRP